MILEEEYKTVLQGKLNKCKCTTCKCGVVNVFSDKLKPIEYEYKTVLEGKKEKVHLRK